MTATFESLDAGDTIEGPKFAVSRESIRLFCDASLDYNPLHLDDDYMKGSFGKTNFGGIIMHGMNNFGLISRMITDWAYPAGAIYRRLETRWVKPVRPGDTIQPSRRHQVQAGHGKIALGSDRRPGAQPAWREGRHRRGHGRVSGPINLPILITRPNGWRLEGRKPVWIDIWPARWPRNRAVPGGKAAGGTNPIFARFGLPNTAFQSNQDFHMKVRNSLKSLRGRHRANRLVRRKGRVYVINKVQRRFKARQG